MCEGVTFESSHISLCSTFVQLVPRESKKYLVCYQSQALDKHILLQDSGVKKNSLWCWSAELRSYYARKSWDRLSGSWNKTKPGTKFHDNRLQAFSSDHFFSVYMSVHSSAFCT